MKALGKALAFVALLALVGAGTATAASMITGKQIENGTVTGADIEKETLSGKHLTDAAKDKLKGATGPAGPAGPAGPQGAAGTDGGPHRYAEVGAAGVLQRTSRTSTRRRSRIRIRAATASRSVRRPPDLGRRDRPVQRHDRDARPRPGRRDPGLPGGRERPGAHVRPVARRLSGQRLPPDPVEQLGRSRPARRGARRAGRSRAHR